MSQNFLFEERGVLILVILTAQKNLIYLKTTSSSLLRSNVQQLSVGALCFQVITDPTSIICKHFGVDSLSYNLSFY